ncbi:uncharacterized protein [Palaemon carinicauda]|uniref:uncharacterized protein n=1 Tax=Palaemon carinicauda TaxID=392227 RepID=UPI0035B59A5E
MSLLMLTSSLLSDKLSTHVDSPTAMPPERPPNPMNSAQSAQRSDPPSVMPLLPPLPPLPLISSLLSKQLSSPVDRPTATLPEQPPNLLNLVQSALITDPPTVMPPLQPTSFLLSNQLSSHIDRPAAKPTDQPFTLQLATMQC